MTQGDEEIDAPSKPTTGISWHANGDANSYHLLHGDRWIAHILMNGELTVSQQEDMLERIVVALDGGLKLACRTACGSGNAVTAIADDPRVGILADSSYINGLRHGYMLGQGGNEAEIQRIVSTTRQQINDARADLRDVGQSCIPNAKIAGV